MLVSPALIQAARQNLILGDEIEVHAKGMPAALRCRELLGHDDYPELLLAEEDESCTTLAESVTLKYIRLSDKHLDEEIRSATLVGLSHRRAVIEAEGQLPRYTNIMLRFEVGVGEKEAPEFYAKVIRPLDESSNLYLIHFTSIAPGMRAIFDQLLSSAESR